MLAATTATLNRNERLFDWYLMPEAYSAPLVRESIEEFGIKRGQTVLDPFCGTGTAPLAAKLLGRNGLGIEVNPFLCFASRVKTRGDFDLDMLRAESASLLETAREVFARLSKDGDLQWSLSAMGSMMPQMPRRERWIATAVAWKVLALRGLVEQHISPGNRDVPMLALASILRGASNMKLSPHAFGSREVKQDAPVLTLFEGRLNRMLDDIAWLSEQEGLGEVDIIEGDVRDYGKLEHPLLPAHLAITSPPYLNNLDYTMQTRLELFFLGFVGTMDDLKLLRKRMMICDAKAMYRDVEDWKRVADVPSVERVAKEIDDKLGNRGWGWDYGFMTRQYFGGLLRAIEATRHMLAPRARFVLVLGESAHGGVLVPVPDIAAELGHIAGFRHAEVRVLRTRRSSSHTFGLKESAVILSA